MRMVRSSEHDATCAPVGLHATHLTQPAWPAHSPYTLPAPRRSHNSSSPASDPLASRLDVGQNASARTQLVWRDSSCSCAPLVASHTRTVSSAPLLARRQESADHTTAMTTPEWPLRA
eukprot:366163-Chlamydomonas_euryale.AAC.1